MDSTLNNEEDDEMIHCPGPSGSFASSEEFTGIDNDIYYGYCASGAYSSADVTSFPNTDAFQDSGWINTKPISQIPEPPQQYENDLAYINPGYPLGDDNIPQSLEGDLGISIITQRPAHPSGNLDRTTIGIPNPTPFSLQPSSEPPAGVMEQVNSTWRALRSNQQCSSDQVSQSMQNLETIKTFFQSKLPEPPAASTEYSSEQEKEMYRCWVCDPQTARATFPTFGTLKRHLAQHSICDCEWSCTECPKVLQRRDRMRDHLMHIHKKSDLLPAEVEATGMRRPYPTHCPLCPVETSSWLVYFDHVKRHCLISPGSKKSSTNGGRSRRGNNGGGNGGNANGNGHSQSFSSAGPSNSNGGSQSKQSNIRTGGIHSHSVSDNRLNSSHCQSVIDAIEQIPKGSSRESRAHLPGEDSAMPNNPQPSQTPGLPRTDHSTKRKRPDENEENLLDSEKCRWCDHHMAKCRQCQPDLCHKCGDLPRSAIQIGASSTTPVQDLPDTSSTIIHLDEPYFNAGALANSGLPQTMPTQLFDIQFLDPRSLDMTNTFTNDLSQNNPFIGVVMDSESHPPLSDLSNKVQKSPIFESDTTLLSSIGLGTLIDPFFVRRQTKQPKAKASGGQNLGLYKDLVLKNTPSPILEPLQLVSRCKCACVTPTVDYEAHESLKLSSNKRIEMTLTMSRAQKSGHRLHTRVRLFVRLFTIHASAAAKSDTQKQRTHSIAPEITDEDAESDTDSEQELTPSSPSGSELTLRLYQTEDMQNWSFSFDVKWALTKLAQWTSGIDADTYQKLLLSDPRYILDLISKDIMYKIFCLLMGHNGLLLFYTSFIRTS
ncbi:hypothetical protein CBS147317_1166 [Penicillium roqueforti]|nr:hypothetical protein CBS147372_6947 [Penicillium roqueforti]KAI3131939.1 hypothetical protein CBS147330_4364 [Penicillium roqueforti]KAI3171737.1 hypothetical protein CBS147317_1166 [Penicillium roqueforti]KAI3234042.1 hypothetical protein CBS147310_4519 [Penicillium roqueforti]KAI3260082.1 hypothetical protein DTO012A9_2950 [Penicillium roqueforti]